MPDPAAMQPNTVRIAVMQTPEFRCDVASALRYLVQASARADEAGVALLIFPEGYLQGYHLDTDTTRDVALDLESPQFKNLLSKFPKDGPMIVLGLIELDRGEIFNTAVVISGRKLRGRYRKIHLLSSERAYQAGVACPSFDVGQLRFGISICYDTNFLDTAMSIAQAGASLIVCCANNMLPQARALAFRDVHNSVRADRCREAGLWLASSDVTGERDGMIGWGPSAIINPNGEVVAQLPLEKPGMLVFDVPVGC
jgi:predicted amidohydrolase